MICAGHKESDLAKAKKTYKAKTGVGCDGFHPKVPQDLTRETRGCVVAFLEKVERCKMTAFDDSLVRRYAIARGCEMATKKIVLGGMPLMGEMEELSEL